MIQPISTFALGCSLLFFTSMPSSFSFCLFFFELLAQGGVDLRRNRARLLCHMLGQLLPHTEGCGAKMEFKNKFSKRERKLVKRERDRERQREIERVRDREKDKESVCVREREWVRKRINESQQKKKGKQLTAHGLPADLADAMDLLLNRGRQFRQLQRLSRA